MNEMPKVGSAPPLHRYVIQIDGIDGDAQIDAHSASAARYRAFRLFRDAGYRMTFRDFLSRATTLHMGTAAHA